MKKRNWLINRQHDIKIASLAKLFTFDRIKLFSELSSTLPKQYEVVVTAGPVVQIPFVLLTYVELLTQYPSFAVEIKRANSIKIFFSLTFHIWSILPFSLAFSATSASVAQVLIKLFLWYSFVLDSKLNEV